MSNEFVIALTKAQQDLEKEVVERAVYEADFIKAKHSVRAIELMLWPTLKGNDTVRRALIATDDQVGVDYRKAINAVVGAECSLAHQAAQATIARDRLNVLFAMARDEKEREDEQCN